jgi:hypothetical protein
MHISLAKLNIGLTLIAPWACGTLTLEGLETYLGVTFSMEQRLFPWYQVSRTAIGY